MNIQRFHATTAREALAQARLTFGEGTLILSNRQTDNGVEVVATGEELLSNITKPKAVAQSKPKVQAPEPPPINRPETTRALVERDTEKLALSTLSFQDYVRERMLHRRHENLHTVDGTVKNNSSNSVSIDNLSQQSAISSNASQQYFIKELQSLKHLMEDRFNTLAWLGEVKQRPIQSHLMHKMIRAGYSATLARTILLHLPDHLGARDAVQWLMQVLERNLAIDSRALHEQRGIYAFTGPTGVGKTTTIAHLAALCAHQYGNASVGVITLDAARVGGHEQLRAWGNKLGIATHLTHDRTALQDLLGLLSGKKMVLIDTTGMVANDSRHALLDNMLALPHIRRLLVLSASAHGDTLDALLTAFQTTEKQQAILTKIDEAAKLGPALDALIRHKMVLRGTTNGQHVPEDWHTANARLLVQQSMRSNTPSAFDPKISELNFFFSPSVAGNTARASA